MRFHQLMMTAVFITILLATVPIGTARAEVTVTSVTPSSALQGTVSLDVEIAGSGFDSSAQVDFLVTGTTNPGGITVKKVVARGSKKLIATIDVAEDAIATDFDIEVTLSGGRKGKGITLFKVQAKVANVNDPCLTPGLDFPAFTYTSRPNNIPEIRVADSTGVCSRLVTSDFPVFSLEPEHSFSYPVNGTTNTGRVVWTQGGGPIYLVDFTVGPGNAIQVGPQQLLPVTGGCCHVALSDEGTTLYFNLDDVSIGKLDLTDPAASPTLIYALPESEGQWWLWSVAPAQNGSHVFAEKHGYSSNQGRAQLIRIDLDTNPVTVQILRENAIYSRYRPSVDAGSSQLAFGELVPGTEGCTQLVVTDLNGENARTLDPPRFGSEPTWLGDNVLMNGIGPMSKRGRCRAMGNIVQIEPDNSETTLTSGSRAKGR
jgi:hypothetical protein